MLKSEIVLKEQFQVLTLCVEGEIFIGIPSIVNANKAKSKQAAESCLFDSYSEKQGKHFSLPSNKQARFANNETLFLGNFNCQELK